MAKSALIRVDSAQEALSKPQKAFNRLYKAISDQKALLESERQCAVLLRQTIAAEWAPQEASLFEALADQVNVLHRQFKTGAWKAGEKKKLSYLISDISFMLAEKGVAGMKELFDQYNDTSFDEVTQEVGQLNSELAKEMMEEMFGITIDKDVHFSGPEEAMAYLDRLRQEQKAEQAEKDRLKAEKKAQKPKTAKQIEAERKKEEKERKRKEEASRVSNSVRDIYMDLVKTFHPDREQDEAEKERKTEIMQRVTAAYEANDLVTLLNLQLEFERISPEAIKAISDERLKLFVKILERQRSELELEYHYLLRDLSHITPGTKGGFFRPISVRQLDFLLKDQLREIKNNIKGVRRETKEMEIPEVLKQYLKSFSIPKKGDMYF